MTYAEFILFVDTVVKMNKGDTGEEQSLDAFLAWRATIA